MKNLLLFHHRGVASFARSGGKGFRRNPKAFSGRNHKFSAQKQVISQKKEGFFWPKSQILTFFPPKNINFFQKNSVGGQEKNRGGKNENRVGIVPPAPPLATRLFHHTR